MGDTKAFTSIFNLVDNFTAKFDGIQKRISAVTDAVHPIDFDIGGDVIAQTKEIGKNLAESSAGISKAAGGAGKAAKSAGDGMKQAADGARGAKSEIEKSTSALERMHSKFSGMTGTVDTLKGKLGAITGLLTGGAIAGMAWSKAMESQNITASLYRRMERKHVDTAELDTFIKAADGKTSTTVQRRDIADVVLSRTSLRGTKAQGATEAIEKLYLRDASDWNKRGIGSSADLANLLTKKTLARGDKQLLIDMGIKGGSASTRIKSAKKVGGDITTEDLEAANPMGILQNQMSTFTTKMGKTLVDPMLKVLTVANKIIDVINSIPGAPNLVALGLVLVSASGAASLLVTALAPLATVYGVLQRRMIAHAAATQMATVEEMMLTGATEAEAMAAVQSGTATNLSWGAKLRLAAANIYASAAAKAHAVATSVSSAATSVSSAVTNSSILATLRLAAARTYASVATRAHTVATMANSTISWASAGAMAALATIYGLLTGSIGLSTIATWGLNTAMAVLDALNPFTYIIAGAALLAGIVGLVAYKSGLLGTIWKDLGKIKFGKIFDDLMKGDFSGAWKRLSKGFAPVISDIKLGASLIPQEISDTITAKLSELVRWVTTSFPFLSKIHDLGKKVYSIFEWIYSLWIGFWNWIKSAIPGAAKESARAKMEKQAEMEHMYLGSDNKWYKLNQDNKGKYTVKSGMLAYTEGSPKLQDLKKKYDELPGFAEGIAEAVARGISGIGTDIANAIKGLVLEIPGVQGLIDAAKSLSDAAGGLQKWVNKLLGNDASKYDGKTELPGSTSEGSVFAGSNGGYDVVLKKDWNGYKAGDMPAEMQGRPWSEIVKYGFATGEDPTKSNPATQSSQTAPSGLSWDEQVKWTMDKFGLAQDQAENRIKNKGFGYATGATFSRSGRFAGNVHAPEEIVPQAIAIKGPGPIARALDAFYGATANRRGASTPEANRPVEVHVHSSYDFSGMRVSSTMDIDKLMREIDRRIESGSVAAVKKAIGQGRN